MIDIKDDFVPRMGINNVDDMYESAQHLSLQAMERLSELIARLDGEALEAGIGRKVIELFYYAYEAGRHHPIRLPDVPEKAVVSTPA